MNAIPVTYAPPHVNVSAILAGITFEKEPKTHNLVIRADKAACESLRKLYRDEYPRVSRLVRIAACRRGGPVMLREQDTVGLTSSPQFASTVDADGRPRGFLWWFPSYEVQNEWEALAENGQVVFRFGCMVRPTRKNATLIAAIRDELTEDDWHGAMGAWFSVAAELWFRNEFVPPAWNYAPGAAADPREPQDSLFEECEGALATELRYAGDVLCRYVRMLEHRNPNRG